MLKPWTSPLISDLMLRAISGRAALSAALLYISCLAANAASVNVVPVRVNLDPGQRSTVVTIQNTGEQALSMQADAFTWTQDEAAADIYAPSDDLLVVPRIFTVPGGGSQIVRIGQIAPAPAPVETAYRVFFTELVSEEGRSSPGLKIRLRIGIPVFIAPAGDATAALDLVRSAQVEDGYEVVYRNSGNVHIQITRVSAKTNREDVTDNVSTDSGLYLLPGTTGRVVMPIEDGTSVSSISATTDTAGTVEHVLPFGN
jgi:fimbrial chaperone protein